VDELARSVQDDPAPPVRLAAIEALGHIGGPKAISILTPVVESPDRDVARAAVVALGLVATRNADAVPPLLAVLRSPDALLRLDALQALRHGVRPNASGVVDTLHWLAANDPDPVVAHSAVDALAELSTPESIAALVALSGELAAHADSYETCVAALARVPAPPLDEKHITWPGRGLSAERAAARCAVIEALARVKRPAASDLILTALDDADPVVRMAAATSLGRLASVAGRSRLAELAQGDPDPGVRRAAQLALGE